MICKSCRSAGELMAMVNAEPEAKLAAETLTPAIKAKHDKCRGGNWCDCQHALGFYLNTPQIEAANVATA